MPLSQPGSDPNDLFMQSNLTSSAQDRSYLFLGDPEVGLSGLDPVISYSTNWSELLLRMGFASQQPNSRGRQIGCHFLSIITDVASWRRN